jgi:Domain of unknown function (DUF4326)
VRTTRDVWAMQGAAEAMTTVVKVRRFARAEFEADPDFIYVGRHGWGWKRSDWCNPFREDKAGEKRDGTHEAVVAKHADWIVRQPHLMARLGELRGKVLGCWCCNWDGHGEPARPCHAVTLARLADGRSSHIG